MIKSTFISAGCSPKANVADWCSSTNRILFAINNDVGIAQLDKMGNTPAILEYGDFVLTATTFAHDKNISCLKVISSHHSDTCVFLTGYSGGELCIWRFNDSSVQPALLRRIPGFDGPLSFVGGLLHDSSCLILCAHNDKITVIELSLLNPEEEYQQNFTKFRNSLVLCFDIVRYDKYYLLSVGLTNGNVELLYSNESNPSNFITGITLYQQRNNWVRSMAFCAISDGKDILSLSASFDSVIRLWNFRKVENESASSGGELRIKPVLLELDKQDESSTLELKLDSVLSGHDGWVQSLRWHPTRRYILSASVDKNVILWKPSTAESIWLPAIRMGQVGGESVGFYDALFSPDGNNILFHSFFGAFHSWKINVDEETAVPELFHIGGHFDNVSDLDWDPTGSYIITCSFDKTTRIFAPLRDKDRFVEIARPQVHGHSLNCIKSINSICFVSGAEEKIFRAFQAPTHFLTNMNTLAGVQFNEKSALTCAVAVPQLGLSNKGISTQIDESGEIAANGQWTFSQPPRDDELSKNTLFPEIHKLYGHGFEVFAITSNHAGTIVVTACKASQEDHASMLMWDTADWKVRSTIRAHQLTVTQMAFSPNDQFLLSVSRDRTWHLTKIGKDGSQLSSVHSGKTGGHSRIIWACAWSHDSQFFATVSRDKTLAIWEVKDSPENELQVAKRGTFASYDSITAVDFAPNSFSDNGGYLFSIGHDDGLINLIQWNPNSSIDGTTSTDCKGTFTILQKLDKNIAFSGTINRINFNRNSTAIMKNATLISMSIRGLYQDGIVLYCR